MIFLSLGTHEQPFPRALELVRPLPASGVELVVQHGFTEPDRSMPHTSWLKFAEYDEMIRLIDRATSFICHAGVGSVLTALSRGVTPVLIPRRAVHGEHVDNHQLQLAPKLAERGLVTVLNDPDDLTDAVNRAATMRGAPRGPGDELRNAIAASTRIG